MSREEGRKRGRAREEGRKRGRAREEEREARRKCASFRALTRPA